MDAIMLAILLLIGATLCQAQEPRTNDLKLDDVLEAATKEGSTQKRVARQDDTFYAISKTRHLLNHQPAPQTYNQLVYNPPSPSTQQNNPPPPATWPVKPPPSLIPCTTNTGVHVSDGHFATPHVPSAYAASIPYISGYKLSPIIGQKQIVVNDVAHLPGSVPCVENYPFHNYYQNPYGTGRQAEDLLKSFEQTGFFVQPPDTSSQLRSANEYQGRIEDLNNQLEYFEALKENTPMEQRV